MGLVGQLRDVFGHPVARAEAKVDPGTHRHTPSPYRCTSRREAHVDRAGVPSWSRRALYKIGILRGVYACRERRLTP
jgi:hypothetical protein